MDPRGGAAVLARADRDGFTLWSVSGLDPDPDWTVARGLATALAEVADEASVSLLFGLLKDGDVRVLPAALKALRKARSEDAVETLRQHLATPTSPCAPPPPRSSRRSQHLGCRPRWRRPTGDPLRRGPRRPDALVGRWRPRRTSSPGPPSRMRRNGTPRPSCASERPGAGRAGRPERSASRAAAVPPLDYSEAMEAHDPRPGRPVFTPRAILFTSRGRIELHLDVIETPLTTASFVALARRGFYDGLGFTVSFRASSCRGATRAGRRQRRSGYTLRCEIGRRPTGAASSAWPLGQGHRRQPVLIALQPAPHLDGGYTAFARVASAWTSPTSCVRATSSSASRSGRSLSGRFGLIALDIDGTLLAATVASRSATALRVRAALAAGIRLVW